MAYNERQDRYLHRTIGLGAGLNMAVPARSLKPGESPYMIDVLTRTGKIVPGKTTGAVFAIATEDIKYGFRYSGASLWLVVMGTTKCWITTGTSLTLKTPSTPFSNVANPQWQGFTMLHNAAAVAVVNNAGNDKPHYWDGGGGLFVILTNAPTGLCAAPYLGHLMLGGINDGTYRPNRLQWSDQDDITAYGGATAGYVDLKDDADPILQLGILPGHILLIFRGESVYIGYPTQSASEIVQTQLLSQGGIHAPGSLQRIEGGYLYLGRDDIYLCTGAIPIRVGWKIREEMFRLIDPDELPNAWSFLDSRTKEYYLVTTMLDGTQHAWIFNYEEQTWSRSDLTGYTSLVRWYETT